MKLKQFNYKKVKSTNQIAINLIKNSKKEFGMVVTETQYGGKGQYGKKWISYKGNILLSFFYKLDKIDLSIGSLTKKNCFLVKDVISKYCKKKINFKQPNDLLVDKKKICGILQEVIFLRDKKFLITGIGINIKKNPTIRNYPATNLQEVTQRKINKLNVENKLKQVFEKNLSKLYKNK